MNEKVDARDEGTRDERKERSEITIIGLPAELHGITYEITFKH
jgi:hypothetical protein